MRATVKEILLYCDEPQLVLLERRNVNYLAWAHSSTDVDLIAICVSISRDTLESVVQGSSDLRSVFQNPAGGCWYTTSLAHGERCKLQKIADTRWDVDVSMLPSFDTYLEPPSGIHQQKTTVSIRIGNRWQLRDLQHFSNRYEEVYSILYSATQNRRNASFNRYPLKRGGSYVRLYDDLAMDVPRAYRPEVKQLQYNSPGFIALSVLPEINRDMRSMIESVVKYPKHAWEVYHEVHSELGKRKLLGENPTDTLLAQHADFLSDSARDLSAALAFKNVRRLISSASPLHAVKVLLSLYRRLMEIREYIDEQKVDFDNSFL